MLRINIVKIYHKEICTLLPLFMLCSVLSAQTYNRAQEKETALIDCKKRMLTSSNYDCDCLISKYDKTVDEMFGINNSEEEISPELLKKYIPHLEKHCKVGRNVHIKKRVSGKFISLKITPVGDPNSPHPTRPACELLEIAKSGKGITSMTAAFSEPHHSAVMMKLYKDTDCRLEDKLYNTYYNEAKTNLPLLGDLLEVSEEQYCVCFAKGMSKAMKEGLDLGGYKYQNMKKKLIGNCRK